MMMAMLGLLAYKAIKGLTGGSKPAAAPAPRPPGPAGTGRHGRGGNARRGGAGGLGDLLKGGLGGLLAGGAAGTVLSGGLNDLLKQLQQSGHGETANSWVGTGPNRPISPTDLGSALGADQIQLAHVAIRPVARRTTRWSQPAPARGGRPPHPRRSGPLPAGDAAPDLSRHATALAARSSRGRQASGLGAPAPAGLRWPPGENTPGISMQRKVMISCAVTGSADTPGRNPAVPVTPQQIAQSAIDAAKAGAAIVHIHVRDPQTTRPSMDKALYREVVERIRA